MAEVGTLLVALERVQLLSHADVGQLDGASAELYLAILMIHVTIQNHCVIIGLGAKGWVVKHMCRCEGTRVCVPPPPHGESCYLATSVRDS